MASQLSTSNDHSTSECKIKDRTSGLINTHCTVKKKLKTSHRNFRKHSSCISISFLPTSPVLKDSDWIYIKQQPGNGRGRNGAADTGFKIWTEVADFKNDDTTETTHSCDKALVLVLRREELHQLPGSFIAYDVVAETVTLVDGTE